MCSLEWLRRLKCRATGLDASLSSFSTSRRCSRNRSPNSLPVSCFSRDQVPTNSVSPSSVYKAYTTHNSSICSDEGLTLETSAFQSLYGGQFTSSTPLMNQIFVFHSPTDAAPQFLQKLTPFEKTLCSFCYMEKKIQNCTGCYITKCTEI